MRLWLGERTWPQIAANMREVVDFTAIKHLIFRTWFPRAHTLTAFADRIAAAATIKITIPCAHFECRWRSSGKTLLFITVDYASSARSVWVANGNGLRIRGNNAFHHESRPADYIVVVFDCVRDGNVWWRGGSGERVSCYRLHSLVVRWSWKQANIQFGNDVQIDLAVAASANVLCSEVIKRFFLVLFNDLRRGQWSAMCAVRSAKLIWSITEKRGRRRKKRENRAIQTKRTFYDHNFSDE